MSGRSRAGLVLGCMVLAFVLVAALRAGRPDPDVRAPKRYRLAALIERRQVDAERLRAEVERLRADVERATRLAARRSGRAGPAALLPRAELAAGLVPVTGDGLEVVLDDSQDRDRQTANVNDLVVHSQDVQAVVNALWRAGAEAVAINGQRLVGSSAVLCVGNTLLLNGTVHSPPYEMKAVGADHDRFEADRLVRRLHGDADTFGLRFSVRRDSLLVPAFEGALASVYARPTSAGGR